MSTKRKLEEEAVESNQMQVESVPVKGNVGSDGIPLELLQVYYNNYFPFKEMAQWLSFGTFQSPDTFKNREFSMMLKGDIYMRFRSYGNFAEWKKEVVKNCPDKMDIGAMYNAAVYLLIFIKNYFSQILVKLCRILFRCKKSMHFPFLIDANLDSFLILI